MKYFLLFLLLPLTVFGQITKEQEKALLIRLNEKAPKEVTFVPSEDGFSLEVHSVLPLKIPKDYYLEVIRPLLNMDELYNYGLIMIRFRFRQGSNKYSGKTFYGIKPSE